MKLHPKAAGETGKSTEITTTLFGWVRDFHRAAFSLYMYRIAQIFDCK
jgi:hypothetical protein